MTKALLLGNEAIARGAYEAGVKFASAYPGTPSSEITKYVAEYDEIFAEWAPNEKVSLEAAYGASLAGKRALCAMKHVGLNVASDPLFTASYTGVNAGLVICVADDSGMHSSQDEQDSRHYARASKTMMLEPSDSAECLEFTKRGYELSEQFDTPVLQRMSTRICHSRTIAKLSDRKEFSKEYKKDIWKYVMMPLMARKRRVVVEERMTKLKEFAETTDLNSVEYNDKKIGVISSGIAYSYAKDALGDNASYLKLGMVYPLPEKLIKDFCASVDVCYVIEELEPYIEEHCKILGLNVKGKECFSPIGEYSSRMISDVVLNKKAEGYPEIPNLPARPPVMCAGCSHRAAFYGLKQIPNLVVTGDIGCYTLGATPPLNLMDSCLDMGAAVSMAHGMNIADPSLKVLGVIGDSTFVHSGITGLIDIVYNKGSATVLILDNYTTGMTGGQDHPGTGLTIKGNPTKKVDFVELCKSIGVERIFTVDPHDYEKFVMLVKAEIEVDEPSVIIAQRPCALLKYVVHGSPYHVDQDACSKCGICMEIGCPAINETSDGDYVINMTLCVGCGYCTNLCGFNAIKQGGDQ